MKHEATYKGQKVVIEYDRGEMAEHVRIYRNGVISDHYIQANGKNTCLHHRNCGPKWGMLLCDETMNTAAHLYGLFCQQFN